MDANATFGRDIKIAPSILSADFANAAADVLVAGSAVFKGGSVANPDVYGENIHAIRAAALAARRRAQPTA